MVLIILLWGMFFSGVGRHLSIDAYLLKYPPTQRWFKYLYTFSLSPEKRNFSKIRFFILFLFWCICVRAMSFHFDDSYWLNGKTLQLLFHTPYLTDHYSVFQKFSEMFSGTFDLLCKLGLFIQSVWELLLFPLMYVRWGRLFVLVQGIGFFLVSIFILNLGYLPYIEICMWIFLFNYSQCLGLKEGQLFYDDRCNLCKKTVNLLKIVDFYDRIEVIGLSQAPSKVQNSFSNDMQIVFQKNENLYPGFSAYYQISKHIFPFLLLFPLFFIGKITGLGNTVYNWVALRRKKLFGVCEPYIYISEKKPLHATGRWSVQIFSVFLAISILIALFSEKSSILGQRAVNVINRADLGMGAPGIVLIETDANGEFMRTVPFMDLNGGRLSYLRNDFLYFRLSLPWQRQYITKNRSDTLQKKIMISFQKLGEAVGALDSCLRQAGGLRYYRADLYIKEPKRTSYFDFWGAPKKAASHSYSVDIDQLNTSAPKCQWAFNLLPGHMYSAQRIAMTDSLYNNVPEEK